MSFDILHFSYRKWNSYHETGCYNINLVFRVWDKTENDFIKGKFLHESKEWKETEIVQDLDLFQQYSDGLRVINKNTGKDIFDTTEKDVNRKDKLIPLEFTNLNNIDRKDVYTKGFQENWNSMFQYIEKFDVFRFYEYFEINPITEGVIEYIEELKKMYNPSTYYADQLFRTLKSLELWWD